MKSLRNLLILFPAGQRWKLAVMLVAMLTTALFEVAGVASIMPFMALLTNPDAIHTNPIFLRLQPLMAEHDTLEMVSVAGGITLTLLILSNSCAMLSNWMMLRFSYGQSHNTGCKLLTHYLHMPYEFFLQRNSTILSKNILTEVHRVTLAVVIPFLQMAAKCVIAVFLVGLLLAVNPLLALSTAAGVCMVYSAMYVVVRRKLNRLGARAIKAEDVRFKTASEALAGIKEIKISGRQDFFLRQFQRGSLDYAVFHSTAAAIAQLPKYVLEIIAFGGIVLIALYLLHAQATPGGILPLIALYAFAGYRLMPAMQQIYAGLVQIRYHGHSLQLIVDELGQTPETTIRHGSMAALPCTQAIHFDHISYSYPGGTAVLHDVTLAIAAKSTVGLAGMSGAGKTTLVDILLGLLPPSSGQLLVDNIAITRDNLPAWQSLLGYVPQHIYLTDDTIASNIAFGIAPTQIDPAQLERAAKLAHLHEFIMTLPDGYQTAVGERGVRLSGGQRQRIGIARALYSNPSVLILDEATSALDNITESAVMEAIGEMSGQLTLIIIAHRLSTLKVCDTIHVMDKGRVVASGSYAELLQHNAEFKHMATMAANGAIG